ncbi:PIN-like domain-containing protein [Methyloligella solikamskensis]|uniref:VapC45 PIN like domain-containing protein n=1 Tax=Methyloligella solikamskensis TaxID=1177756 RepID=A0ABW3JCI3_9HYPH
MKVVLDECLPIVLVEAFQAFADRQIIAHEIVHAKQYRPDGEKGDKNWIIRFAEDGGEVVISGDTQMRQKPHERLALSRAGLITIFFEPRWGRANCFVKAAMMLRWWPKIDEHIATASAGSCWEIPYLWNWKPLRDVSARPDQVL